MKNILSSYKKVGHTNKTLYEPKNMSTTGDDEMTSWKNSFTFTYRHTDMERAIHTQTETHTDRQTDREADTHTYTYRDTNSNKNTETEAQTEIPGQGIFIKPVL